MKVKHLIKKLQQLDPEAKVYVGSVFDNIPARHVVLGTRFQREKIFVSQAEANDPARHDMVQYTLRLNGASSLTNEDVLISNWDCDWSKR